MGPSLADAGQCTPENATASNDPEWTHFRVMLEVPLLADQHSQACSCDHARSERDPTSRRAGHAKPTSGPVEIRACAVIESRHSPACARWFARRLFRAMNIAATQFFPRRGRKPK